MFRCGIALRRAASLCAKKMSMARNYSTTARGGVAMIRTAAPRRIHVGQPVAAFGIRAFSTEPIVVPDLGDSITEGTVVEWVKVVEDYVNVDDVVCVLETDKVSVDIRSDKAGKLTEQLAEEGDTVEVGVEIAKLDTAAEAPAGGAPAPEAAPPTAAPASAPTPAPSPAAPKPAPAASKPAAAAAPPAAETPARPRGGSREETRVKMSRMRLRIAERLKDAQNTAAMLTTFQECDMTNIMSIRSKYKDQFVEKHGAKLGFMSCFVSASANALMAFPQVNASIDGKEIVYKDYADVSIAVATPTGLVTPVLRNAESMSFDEIEAEIAALGRKARDGKIAIEDMLGGTFTISNGGVYGSLMGTPIINPPQTAILGMHGIVKRPVAVGDNVEVRPMMYLALTYDHRLIDGSDAVLFLRKIKEGVEDPVTLLLGL